MSNGIQNITTSIELSTDIKPAHYLRKIEYKSGEVISYEIPLKNISDKVYDLSIKDINMQTGRLVIELLSQSFPKEPNQE